ncbi:MAG: cytochrome c biogenesis ATP-binding export protein CcmA [Hyphobacterium sp.]|nr:MAG: cytochrome c biogenesis ATP-binding export protein CcmA [Hyphobacterium sp.]
MTLPDFSPTSLNVTDLSLERADIPLIAGLNLTLNSGEAIVLIGRNGVGKTTLLRALAGVLQPGEGQILYSGVRAELAASKCCGFLGHEDALKPDETPRQSLEFWARLSDRPQAVNQGLEQMGLRALADRSSRRLSQGQKRRTALARIAVQNRPVWLLDEPAAPLDEDGRERLSSLVSSHLMRGGLVIAATHQALAWPNARTQELARCAR